MRLSIRADAQPERLCTPRQRVRGVDTWQKCLSKHRLEWACAIPQLARATRHPGPSQPRHGTGLRSDRRHARRVDGFVHSTRGGGLVIWVVWRSDQFVVLLVRGLQSASQPNRGANVDGDEAAAVRVDNSDCNRSFEFAFGTARNRRENSAVVRLDGRSQQPVENMERLLVAPAAIQFEHESSNRNSTANQIRCGVQRLLWRQRHEVDGTRSLRVHQGHCTIFGLCQQ